MSNYEVNISINKSASLYKIAVYQQFMVNEFLISPQLNEDVLLKTVCNIFKQSLEAVK